MKAFPVNRFPFSFHSGFTRNKNLILINKMGFANIWYSHPRKYGQGSRSCRSCANRHGIIRKYGLNICRQCFREYANDIGFKKLD